MLNNTSQRHKKSFISIWGAGIAAVFIFNFCNQNDFIRAKTEGSNLIQYAAMCAAFIMMYLAMNLILEIRVFHNERFLDAFCIISCVSIAWFMCICWQQDVKVNNSHADDYIWHMYPAWIVLLILCVLTLLYEAVAMHVDFSRGKLRYCVFLYYALITFLGGFLNYYLNYLDVDNFHGSAVFNSVYNVMHGVPYEEISNSVYGNYALLLAIPMKILGNGEYFDLSRIMCLLTMVCIALGIYVIHNLIERKDTRLLCVSALLWVYIFRKTNYWQLYPMRILCPMILLAWMVFLNKRENCDKKIHKYLLHAFTYFILVFSIVWNKESGVVCLIGYLVFSFAKGLAVSLTKNKWRILGTLLECVIMITTIISAFFVVGIYNLIAAGKWITWQVFFFPLFTRRYMVDSLMMSLQKGIWPWMAVAFLFLAMFCRLGIKILCKQEIDPKEYIYTAAAVIGLGLMTYFINRATYMNLTICYYEAVICIGGIVCSMEREDYGIIIARFMKAISTLVLVALVVGEVLHLGTAMYTDRGTSRQEILTLRDQIREDAEEDTYAFGINIPELYSLLGWDTRSYTTDWADVFITRDLILDKIYRDLEAENAIITDKKTFDRYEDVKEYVSDRFYIDKTYSYNENVEFYLMKRK